MSPGDVVSTAQTGDGTCPVEVEGKLQGKMSWWYLFAMSVASILGPWVVMSWGWYSISGPSIALAFVIVGLVCIPIGLVYGELSAMFPKTGGSFLFIKHGLGKETSYWIAWTLLLSYLALMSYMMYQFATIISTMWFAMSTESIMILSVLMTIGTFILTWRKVDLSAAIQFFLFAFTLVAGLLYLILFVFSPDFNPGVNWNPYFAFGDTGFLSGVGLMVTMYFGFELIPQFAEECDYPHKNHWKVMMFSVMAAMIIYVSICVIETAVRPMSAILDLGGPYVGFVGAVEARQIYGNWLAYPIVFASIATLISCVIGFWLGASRVMYSMGREGVMPHIYTRTNVHHQPYIANITIAAITILLTVFCYAAGINWIIPLYTLMAIGVAIAYTFTCIAYVRMKYTLPNHPRLWKVPGGKVMGIAAAGCGAFITYWVFWSFSSPAWVFDSPTWQLFYLFFVVVIFLRIYLAWDRKAHSDKYYDVDDKLEEAQMAEEAKKEA
jgi:APA family basic amino acid/polyamine antiporter